MKQQSIHGVALIVGSLAGIVTMIFHPSGLSHRVSPDQLGHLAQVAVATHALALVSLPILVFGFLGFTLKQGGDRPLIQAGFVAYVFASLWVSISAVSSGLIAPRLIGQMVTADESTQKVLQTILSYNFQLNQGFAKLFVIGSSVAVILWSISLLKSGTIRWLGILGCVIGLVNLFVFGLGHLRLNVHGFGLFTFIQSTWVILLGAMMCRSIEIFPSEKSSG